jgi:CBS domain-containing protein
MNAAPPNPELDAIQDFLLSCIPFDQLTRKQISFLVSRLQIQYYCRGHVFLGDQELGGLRIVRSGAVELRTEDGTLIDKLGEGLSFNLLGLQQEQPGIRATLIEDALIYFIAEEDYQTIRQQDRDFDRFFHSQRSRRIRSAVRTQTDPGTLIRSISDVMATDVLTVDVNSSIQQTALQMSERRVSSVLVVADGQLTGLVTDRDIRMRAVATGMDLHTPIYKIMTHDPAVLTPQATLFDATLMMTRSGYHHVPVLEGERIAGIVTASDMMLARQDDPVYLVQHIGRQNSVGELKAIVESLPNLLVQWVNAGTRADHIGHILTAISDAVTTRLIEMAITELGEPPAPFCWLGFGSQGRGEQLLGADQDNGLVMDDSVKDSDKLWFEKLAHRVCDGLNRCGYVYCNGKVMAMTDDWRLPLAGWQQTVDRWADTPTPDAVMRVSIFFDIRSVYGDASLCQRLQQHMLQRVKGNSIFLAALAENVLDIPPPLGIFRRFVVEHDGAHRDELNLKKRGLLPIIDIVRIHALANGIAAINTHERLQALVDKKAMAMTDSRNLQDAMRMIMKIRLQKQSEQVVAGAEVSNYLNPDELSPLARKQLKDAFSVIKDALLAVKMNYRPGM